MPSFRNFARHVPAHLLQRYLETIEATLPVSLTWDADRNAIARQLVNAYPSWTNEVRARIDIDAERVWALADEPGRDALLGAYPRPADLRALDSNHARSIFVYLNDTQSFLRAEASRLTDERRQGRMWTAFPGPADIELQQDEASLAQLAAAIKLQFETPRARVETYARSRPKQLGDEALLTQVNVYRQNLPNENWVLGDGDELAREVRREVVEAAITYERSTGIIEVAGPAKDARVRFAQLVSECLLLHPLPPSPIGKRQYDLSRLRTAQSFPTEPQDAIDSVRVTRLRLAPVDGGFGRVTLDISSQASETIWQMAEARFRSSNPLAGGWYVTQAQLAVRFLAADGAPATTVSFVIGAPDSCNLKELTERQRILGEKYLRRWGIRLDG